MARDALAAVSVVAAVAVSAATAFPASWPGWLGVVVAAPVGVLVGAYLAARWFPRLGEWVGLPEDGDDDE